MSIAENVEFSNPHLQGNNRPVYDEITATDLEVIGQIPTDIEGSFLRIGPNPYYVPDQDRYHIFDGDGMIHGVHISQGGATYRNRFIDSAGLREERADAVVDHLPRSLVRDLGFSVEPPARGSLATIGTAGSKRWR